MLLNLDVPQHLVKKLLDRSLRPLNHQTVRRPLGQLARGQRERVRSWLYAEPTVQDHLAKVTAAASGSRRPIARPAPHPASGACLRARLVAAVDRVRRVEAESRQLRDQLAKTSYFPCSRRESANPGRAA